MGRQKKYSVLCWTKLAPLEKKTILKPLLVCAVQELTTVPLLLHGESLCIEDDINEVAPRPFPPPPAPGQRCSSMRTQNVP